VNAQTARKDGSRKDYRDSSDDLLEARLQTIERRLAGIEQRTKLVAAVANAGLYQFWRRKIRPRLFTPEQYASRRLRIPPDYRLQRMPNDPPRIAIVTPTLNQGKFIRTTIDSVLRQDYPKLAYVVRDGGSTDETRQILRSYGEKLQWQSEPDTGQANAINRGFREVDGEIMGYLNSDDTLMPGALAYVAQAFRDDPEVDVVYSHRIFVDADGLEIGRCILPPHDAETLKWADYIPQETLFWRWRVWDAVGPFDETFNFALDWDFVLRAQTAGFKFKRLPRFLACFRCHTEQKTMDIIEDVGTKEMRRIRAQYIGDLPGQYEIRRAITGYLLQQLFFDWLYRLRLVKY
jgi:glycosyltransferase involved in cell wall biosynthesis